MNNNNDSGTTLVYLTKSQLHVSASFISLMIVYITKSKHVTEVVKYTRYTSRTPPVSVPRTYVRTNTQMYRQSDDK
jgi:hypothetical protein